MSATEHGCAWCRERWIVGGVTDEPKRVGSSATQMVDVFQCSRCNAWWAYGPWSHHPEELDDDTARRWLAE